MERRKPINTGRSLHEDMAAVIEIACLIEDRDTKEHKAMLRVARLADDKLNANVVTNKRMWGQSAGTTSAVQQMPLSELERLVEQTRQPV